MHEFPSSFFLDFLFCLNQNHMHTSFYIFFVHSQFYFWKLKMRSLSKCFFVCIKCIETVMIRCASAHTHKLQNFYFFFPSLFNCWQMELTRKVYLFSDISQWLKKSHLEFVFIKNAKNHISDYLETCSLRSNSVTRQL